MELLFGGVPGPAEGRRVRRPCLVAAVFGDADRIHRELLSGPGRALPADRGLRRARAASRRRRHREGLSHARGRQGLDPRRPRSRAALGHQWRPAWRHVEQVADPAPARSVPTRIPSKVDNLEVSPGDRVVFKTAGSGGWGDPLDRDPGGGGARRALWAGVARARPKTRYGVVLTPDEHRRPRRHGEAPVARPRRSAARRSPSTSATRRRSAKPPNEVTSGRRTRRLLGGRASPPAIREIANATFAARKMAGEDARPPGSRRVRTGRPAGPAPCPAR